MASLTLFNPGLHSCPSSPSLQRHHRSFAPFHHPPSASRVPVLFARPSRTHLRLPRAMAEATKTDAKIEEKLGVRIERNPPESRLSQLRVRSWPKWGCPPSKFPWTYSSTETCYLLAGKVKVYVEGSTDYVEIGAGDLVVFPNGMSCTWEVSEAVDKHYSFA